jgi:hypothetical protein
METFYLWVRRSIYDEVQTICQNWELDVYPAV